MNYNMKIYSIFIFFLFLIACENDDNIKKDLFNMVPAQVDGVLVVNASDQKKQFYEFKNRWEKKGYKFVEENDGIIVSSSSGKIIGKLFNDGRVVVFDRFQVDSRNRDK